MRRVVTTSFLPVSIAACLAFAGAVATAEAGRGGGGGHMGGGHMSGDHMGHTAGGALKGGSVRMGSGGVKVHSYGGGKSFRYSGGGNQFKGSSHGKHYAYGGKWPSNDNFNHHNKHHNYYRRSGYYPWYGLPLYSYYGGGCGWLYRKAVATGSDYWWNRYYQCTGYY
jgi:hypothetical protein